MKPPFRSLLLSISLFVLPLLLANIYYIDDNGRAALGYTNWGPDGRPLADIVIKALFLSSHISDIFPLPLIATVLILAASLTQFSHHFLAGRSLSTVSLVSMTVFCNPYLLEIFSYRFDVLTLGSALSLSLIYCCRTDSGRRWLRFILGTGIIVAIYCLYQTMINIAVFMIIADFIRNLHERCEPTLILKSLARRIAEFFVGTLLYLKVILPATFSRQDVANHPTIATNNISVTIINNLNSYLNFVNSTLAKHQGGVHFLMIICLIAMISALVISLRYLRLHKGPLSLLVCFGAIIAPCVAVLLIPGSLLLLKNSLLTPRSLAGLSGYMLLTALLFTYALPQRLKSMNWLLIIPVLQSLILVYTYGNSLREQAKFNDDLVRQIKTDTRDLDYNSVYFIYSGQSAHSPVYNNAMVNYPVLSVLIPDYFSNWYWPVGNMMMNGLNQHWASPETGINTDVNRYICHSVIFSRNQDYIMWKLDNVIVVDFNRTNCQQ